MTRCGAVWAVVLLIPAAVLWAVVQHLVDVVVFQRRRQRRDPP